ncbi:chaplin [Streptomyces sp. NPDC003753]|uniref:chaplin n=1 Tax=Streptomyces sp. NPDC058960 TaxID=3346679 RepID=UPI00369896E2
MRQTLSRGMVAAAAATGILSLCGSPVFADSTADGSTSGSPGLASGNTVQAPVNVPVNVCGNTVNVIAVLNPAFGNACANGRGAMASPAPVTPAPTPTVPVQTPPRGNGSGTPSTPPGSGTSSTPPGSGTTNPPGSGATPQTPGTGTTPPTGTLPPQAGVPQTDIPRAGVQPVAASHTLPALAETGSEGLLAASAVSVAMLTGGLILYRRGRVTSRR